MSIVKVIEVIATSKKSWDDAAQNAVTEAAKTVNHIKQIYIENMTATVDAKGKISEFRANVKISFLVEN
jgi:flavin-binding protein dodecin